MEIFSRKPKFVYKVSDNYYFKEKDIYDPHELIEHIKNEDYRFRQDFLQETITITKIRNNKYGKIYYAKRIHLPQEERVDWYDELTGFFAKKPQEYTLAEPTDDESNTEENETLTLEEFEFDLQAEPEYDSEIVKASEDETIEHTVNEPNSGSTIEEQEFIKVSKEEFLSLQMEIQQLKSKSRLEKGLAEEHEEQEVSSSEQTNFATVEVVDPLSKNMDQLFENTYTDEIVENVLRMTKHEMDQQLSQFVASETAKIQAEIQQLDKRNLIEDTITKRIESEKEELLAKLNIQMTSERDQEIHEENLRHETRLDEIANTYHQNLMEKTANIKEKLKEKLATSIKEEYEQQSEQLSRILQGKMDELKLRQQAVNAGLEANFKEALENFNYQHKLVLQEVEKKKQSSPINLEEIRKLKQA
ncbi:hypothetical protein MCG01_05375 [Enterococcus hirae]|nr:hypothetical protein [Enterococcus hirae]